MVLADRGQRFVRHRAGATSSRLDHRAVPATVSQQVGSSERRRWVVPTSRCDQDQGPRSARRAAGPRHVGRSARPSARTGCLDLAPPAGISRRRSTGCLPRCDPDRHRPGRGRDVLADPDGMSSAWNVPMTRGPAPPVVSRVARSGQGRGAGLDSGERRGQLEHRDSARRQPGAQVAPGRRPPRRRRGVARELTDRRVVADDGHPGATVRRGPSRMTVSSSSTVLS